MYNIKDILTLSDNNKYIVINKLNYNNTTYYMLLDYYDDNIWFIMYEDGKFLKIEEDEETLYYVLKNFNVDI